MSYFDSFIIFFLTLGMTSLKCFINFAFTQVLGLVDNGSMQCNLISKLSWRAGSIERLEGRRNCQIIVSKEDSANGFEMPLHFPRYTKEDNEKMEDWKLDMVLKEYGLTVKGALDAKRSFVIGTFICSN